MYRFIFASLAALSMIAFAPGSMAQQVLTDAEIAADQRLVDAVSSALDASQYHRLDQILAEAHRKAVETRDFKPLRAAYRTIFNAANHDRFARSQAWLQAIPGSAYAATALGWAHYQRASDFRGESYSRYVSREAFAGYLDELKQAQKLAEQGIARSDDFLPAIDLLLQLRRAGANKLPVPPLVNRALDVAPGRYVLLKGVEALDPRWGGNLTEVRALCTNSALKITGYSVDLCMTEAVFALNLQGDMRTAALNVLDRSTADYLDYARLDAYLSEWGNRPRAAQEAMRIVRAQSDPSGYALNVIATRFGQKAFYQEMLPKVEAAERARLKDAPDDTRVLLILSQDILQRFMRGDRTADPAEAFSLWRKTLVLGGYRGDVWLAGSRVDAIANGSWDYERRRPFYENAIYYSNYQPAALNAYLSFLGQMHDIATNPIYSLPKGTVFDRDRIRSATACELVRATRLFDEACRSNPQDSGCRIHGTVEVGIAAAKELMAQGRCEKERTAPFGDLTYSPVPREQFVVGPDRR